MVILIYDAENVEFKIFSTLNLALQPGGTRGHL